MGTQIFETSFFVFQTIERLIYELALEFHCRKATDEKITENEIFVRREREKMNLSSRTAHDLPSSGICFALNQVGASGNLE